MANCLFCTPNYSDGNATVTPALSGGSWSGSLPLANLADRRLAKVARSTSASLVNAQFDIDLGVSRGIRLFAIPKHNLSLAAKIRIRDNGTALLSYAPGDTIAGESFTRATSATYIDSGGLLQTASTGVKRDAHYVNGVRTLLLEPQRNNEAIQSNDFSTASWTKFQSTITTGQADPNGGTTGSRLQTSSGVGYLEQGVSAIAGGAAATFTIWAKSNTGSTQSTLLSRGSTQATISVTTSWQRFTLTSSASGQNYYLQANGANLDILIAWAQVEAGSYATSYIPTTTIAVTRNADIISWPFTAIPQNLTAYAKLVSEQSSNFDGSFIFAIGTAAGTRLTLHRTNAAATITGTHKSAAGTVTSVPAAVVAVGDTVETRTVLAANGSIIQADAVNAGAETVGSTSAANALDGAFGATIIYIGADAAGANVGAMALVSIKIAAGTKTLAQMQSLSSGLGSVYDSGWLDVYGVIYPTGTLPVGHPSYVTRKITAEELAEQRLAGINYGFVHIAPAHYEARNWRIEIDDTTNAAGYVELGRLVMAPAWQPSINMDYGAKLGWETSTTRAESDGGAAIFNRRAPRRVFTCQIANLPEDEALVSPFQFESIIGTSTQIFFVFDPSDTAHMWRRSFLGTMKELSALEFPYLTRGQIPIAVIEEL